MNAHGAESVSRLVFDARSLLARLGDELAERPGLKWVANDVDEVRAVLAEAQKALPDA